METKHIVDSILEAVREEVTQFVKTQDQISSSIEYEEGLLDIGRQFTLGLLEESSGKLPKSRNSKKKVLPSLGKVRLKKDHILCKGTSRFGISERMRVVLCNMVKP